MRTAADVAGVLSSTKGHAAVHAEHRYTSILNGFSAKLTDAQRQALSG